MIFLVILILGVPLHYIKKNDSNPSSMIEAHLIKAFKGNEKIEVSIEIFTRVGILKK